MADSKIVAEHAETRATIRKQKRALLTRHELLRSAREIFARDGFEHARLEDIASNAGKTRGAFYDNFKDKEDVFCAIFEENIDREMAELEPVLLALPTVAQRIEALGNYLSELSRDQERLLLSLEFKLYAIRHPTKRKRLADLHNVMLLRSSIPELTQLLPQVIGQQDNASLADCLALGGVMDGLALNHLFNPETVKQEQVERFLKLCLQETTQTLHMQKNGNGACL
ncbi:TetR/AcrR family transcriptional regulator [Granulicella sibirica]|nr:TetR/AcrR family transcriptional regulator [Granulicella sibirica]